MTQFFSDMFSGQRYYLCSDCARFRMIKRWWEYSREDWRCRRRYIDTGFATYVRFAEGCDLCGGRCPYLVGYGQQLTSAEVVRKSMNLAALTSIRREVFGTSPREKVARAERFRINGTKILEIVEVLEVQEPPPDEYTAKYGMSAIGLLLLARVGRQLETRTEGLPESVPTRIVFTGTLRVALEDLCKQFEQKGVSRYLEVGTARDDGARDGLSGIYARPFKCAIVIAVQDSLNAVVEARGGYEFYMGIVVLPVQ